MNVEHLGVYGEGDTVIVEQRFRASLANGNEYGNNYCFIFKARDGRICEVGEYMDTLKGFRQVFGRMRSGR